MNAKQRNTRDQRIVELRACGLTLQAIAEQFGLTRERVRQITDCYHIARAFTTIPELTARFGVTPYEVMKALEAAGLNHQARQGRDIIIADQDLDKVVQHLNRHVARQCLICDEPFQVPVRSRKRFCSPECFQKYRRRMRQFPPGKQRPMSETTRQIRDLLSAEPPGETWVGFTEALRLTGMKKMQLVWLRWRGMIACVPSDKRARFGQPRMLYSARHCELIRQFF